MLTAHACFIRINFSLYSLGEAILEEPPVDPPPNPLATLTAAGNAGGSPALALTFTATPLSAGEWLEVWACKCQSAGIKYVKNLRRLLQREEEAASPLDIHDNFVERFGVLQAGETLHFFCNKVNSEGLKSEGLVASCVVGAGV